jgi:hypothetical protein
MTTEYIQNALSKLKELGATEIMVSFDGCGDSGSIENIDIKRSDGTTMMDELIVDYPVRSSRYENGDWINEVEVKQMSINEVLESYCYDELEKTSIDWYNNDGGFGELRITLSDEVSIELEVNQRYTEYSTYSFSLSEE